MRGPLSDAVECQRCQHDRTQLKEPCPDRIDVPCHVPETNNNNAVNEV